MNCTELRKLLLTFTWRLNVLLTSIQQTDSVTDLFIPLKIIFIVIKTIWLYLNGCLMKGKLSQFIYNFPQVMKVLWKHLLASWIISPTKKCRFNVVWNARKVQSLFPLKDKLTIIVVSFIGGIVLAIKIILERQSVMRK